VAVVLVRQAAAQVELVVPVAVVPVALQAVELLEL
jgi:hypothetical protein